MQYQENVLSNNFVFILLLHTCRQSKPNLLSLKYLIFVKRVVFPVVPPKVEYTITARGKRAISVIEVIRNYGLELMKEFDVPSEKIKNQKKNEVTFHY